MNFWDEKHRSYARVAEAFINCNIDLFERMNLAKGICTPLTGKQNALGGYHGDIVAAVLLYLE